MALHNTVSDTSPMTLSRRCFLKQTSALAGSLVLPTFLTIGCTAGTKNDAVAQRATALLNQYLDLFYPSDRSTMPAAVEATVAFASLYLNRSPEIVADTNKKLTAFLTPFVEKQYWLSPKADSSSLYWNQTMLIKLALQDETKSRLTQQNINLIKELLWSFLVGFNDEEAKFAFSSTDPTEVRRIQGSDNHDMIRHGFFLLASQLLMDDPDYAQRKLPDGTSPPVAYQRWVKNLAVYFPEKAAMGIVAEIASPIYVGVYLQSVFVIADHAADRHIRELAARFLDLFFADAAQETLNGIRGGARSRTYKVADGYDDFGDDLLLPLFVLTGLPSSGPLYPIKPHIFPRKGCMAVLGTSYRLPPVVAELFANRTALGSFQYDSERPATGSIEMVKLRDSPYPIYTPDQRSSDVRSSWVTPDYVLGWFTIDESKRPLEVYVQNEEVCAITSVSTGRVSITGVPTSQDRRTSYNDFQCVGAGGCVLVRHAIHAQDRAGFRLYFSSDFIAQNVEDWLLMQAGDHRSWFAFRAVNPADPQATGLLTKQDWSPEVPGRRLVGQFFQTAPETVLVIESGGATSGTSDQFLASLRETEITIRPDSVIRAQKGSNRSLTLYNDARIPLIDGRPVTLPPPRIFSSPFLESDNGTHFTVRLPSGASQVIDLKIN